MKINQGIIIANRYEIIEQIGSGGMALVYRAKDIKLDRFVTFKVMREDYVLNEEFQSKFEIEAKASARLSNKNIVSVYDAGQEDLVRYIVMEYIDGVTLKELIKKRGKFENDETLGVAIQIATALEHAHKHKIIHRDIKPQNILVTNNSEVKVTDFGIARAMNSNTATITSSTSSTMGSVHYFSPEQARGGYVDEKTDIYSLGLVMFEMSTGTIPYSGENAVSIALKHINDNLPDIKALNPKVSDEIIKIILKATEKSSSQRYSNISHMLKDLKRALTYEAGEIEFDNIDESPTLKLSSLEIDEIKNTSKIDLFTDVKLDLFTDNKLNYDYTSKQKNKNNAERNVIVSAILTSFLIIAIVMTIGYFKIFSNFGKDIEFDFTSIIGKSINDVEDMLKEYDLKINIASQEYSNNLEEDKIISYTLVEDKNGNVKEMNLVTSLGIESYTMPDLLNKDIDVVYNILREYPLIDNRKYISHDNVPIDIVFEQEPEPGEVVEANSTVTLYISKGAEIKQITVPTLIGLTDAEAIEVLESIGLTVGKSSSEFDDEITTGRIITQSIQAGTSVPQGTTVNYVISNGEDTSNTSNLVKKKLTVNYTNMPVNNGKVHLKILQIINGVSSDFYNGIVDVSSFPLEFTVEGNGKVIYSIYLANENEEYKLQGEEEINFSKG